MKEFSKLFTQVAVMDTEGNQTGIDFVEVSTDDVIRAALGGKVLWSVDLGAADAGRTITPLYRDAYRAYRLLLGMGVLVQVWPEGDNE